VLLELIDFELDVLLTALDELLVEPRLLGETVLDTEVEDVSVAELCSWLADWLVSIEVDGGAGGMLAMERDCTRWTLFSAPSHTSEFLSLSSLSISLLKNVASPSSSSGGAVHCASWCLSKRWEGVSYRLNNVVVLDLCDLLNNVRGLKIFAAYPLQSDHCDARP